MALEMDRPAKARPDREKHVSTEINKLFNEMKECSFQPQISSYPTGMPSHYSNGPSLPRVPPQQPIHEEGPNHLENSPDVQSTSMQQPSAQGQVETNTFQS